MKDEDTKDIKNSIGEIIDLIVTINAKLSVKPNKTIPWFKISVIILLLINIGLEIWG